MLEDFKNYLDELQNISSNKKYPKIPNLNFSTEDLLKLNREAKKYKLANKQLYYKKQMEDIITMQRLLDIRVKHPFEFHTANQLRIIGLKKTQEDKDIHLKEI